MTETLLANKPPDKVLEIGTGSGYQTTILSNMVKSIYSVERIKALHNKARIQLRMLSILSTQLQVSDGNVGWAAAGPFDGIIVTTATRIPNASLNQLSPTSGRIVIPVGGTGLQTLVVVVRNGNKYLTPITYY